MAEEPAVTGWDDGLCQDYSRELGRWFADRLGARFELRKLFAIMPKPAQNPLISATDGKDSRTTEGD